MAGGDGQPVRCLRRHNASISISLHGYHNLLTMRNNNYWYWFLCLKCVQIGFYNTVFIYSRSIMVICKGAVRFHWKLQRGRVWTFHQSDQKLKTKYFYLSSRVVIHIAGRFRYVLRYEHIRIDYNDSPVVLLYAVIIAWCNLNLIKSLAQI